MDLSEIWKITLAQIEVKIDNPAHFKTWFKDTKLIEIGSGQAKIGVRNSYTSEWLHKKHHKMIKDTLSYVQGSDIEPYYVIDKELVNIKAEKVHANEIPQQTVPTLIGFSEQPDTHPNLLLQVRRANLKEDYTFSSYIVGQSNKLAHAAAMGVSNRPGELYNPLFIYGKTGLGKTHLGQAVARQMLENDFHKKIMYIPCEGFLNEMVKAIKTGKTLEFKQKYRSLDLLIIDDIQFISKWQETQNEFFNTFNVLHNDKKQIILISDRPPEQITGIEDRLRSRFQGGILADVSQPDIEMRLAIVQKKASQLNIHLPDKVYEYIAKIIDDNIRELEGALQKVSLYQAMFSSDITYEEVEKMLGKDKKSRRQKIKVPHVLKTVAKEFNLTVKEIKGSRRTEQIAFARQVCMYILREDFGFKLEQVAQQLERKDHTTVMHAIDKIKSKIMIDEGFKNQMELLRENIMKENDL